MNLGARRVRSRQSLSTRGLDIRRENILLVPDGLADIRLDDFGRCSKLIGNNVCSECETFEKALGCVSKEIGDAGLRRPVLLQIPSGGRI